jgi:hypothetical protein
MPFQDRLKNLAANTAETVNTEANHVSSFN